MKDTSPFKKPSNGEKGAPRADMVCDNEHVQAAKRYARLHSRRSDTFNLYQADDDREIQDDTEYHSMSPTSHSMIIITMTIMCR
jgi:hypothetical protein